MLFSFFFIPPLQLLWIMKIGRQIQIFSPRAKCNLSCILNSVAPLQMKRSPIGRAPKLRNRPLDATIPFVTKVKAIPAAPNQW